MRNREKIEGSAKGDTACTAKSLIRSHLFRPVLFLLIQNIESTRAQFSSFLRKLDNYHAIIVEQIFKPPATVIENTCHIRSS